MIIVLTGENSFALKRELNTLVSAFLSEHGDFGLERFDGEESEYDRSRESLESLPFLAAKKLVVLRSPSANKQFLEHAERLFSSLPDSTDVIVIEPKLDKRTVYYKYLKKQPGFTEYAELDELALAKWLSAEAKVQGGTLSPGDARYLAERVGLSQQILINELTKLISYDANITRETINLLTEPSPQSTIFELLEAAFAGRSKRALEIYQNLRQAREEPIAIIAMIAWQLHVLALVKTAGSRDSADLAREAKVNPFVVRKSQGIANRMTLAELKDLTHTVLELDVALKSRSIDPDEALKNLIVTWK